MSTEIGKVNGRREIDQDSTNRTVKYTDSEIYVTRFAGQNGPMVQLTLEFEQDCIQLTKDQAMELVKLLKKTFE